MSSWALCGFQEEEEHQTQCAPTGGLSQADKVAVGVQCKELLDAGRVLWLRDRGFRVRLVRYVDPDISPENTLLLALPATTALSQEVTERKIGEGQRKEGPTGQVRHTFQSPGSLGRPAETMNRDRAE